MITRNPSALSHPILTPTPGSAAMALDPIHNHGQGLSTLLASVQVIVKDNSKV